ncbi:oligosaccharide repeat unit polymerase, partial [Salinivibrio sp. VGrn1]
LYDLVFYLPSSMLDIYPDLNGFYTYFFIIQILIYILFTVIFTFLYSQNVTRKKKKGGEIQEGLGLTCYFFIMLFCIFLFLFLFQSVFNSYNFTFLLTQNAKFYAQSKVGTAWVFYLYQSMIFLMLYDIYKSGSNKYKLCILFLVIVLLALSGGRAAIISYFLFLSFIYFISHEKPLRFIHAAFFTVIFLTIMVGNALIRQGHDTSFLEYVNSDAFKLDFNSSFVLQDSIDYIDNKNDHYLVALKDFYYAFVPRSLMPDKPVSTAETRLVYKDMLSDGRTTNITFGIYGNMILNFGYSGLFLGFLLLFFANYRYVKVCLNIPRRRAIDFIFLFLFMMFVLVLRGGFLNIRIVLPLMVLIFVVVTYESLGRLKVLK